MDIINYAQLRSYCLSPFEAFVNMPGAQLSTTPRGRHIFFDNGADILAVAHLDTVQDKRHFDVIGKGKKARVYNCQLDDRLGAFLLLYHLPRLGMHYDVLLTENEETCNSTAQDFDTVKRYNWSFMFDRAGTDVVMYQYEDKAMCELVEASGARVGIGSYSCIVDLDHLGCKGFNWGCGYQFNHSLDSHFKVRDMLKMVNHFQTFYNANATTRLEYDPLTSYHDYTYRSGDIWDAPHFDGWSVCSECGENVPDKYFYKDLQVCHECAYWYGWEKGRITK